MTSFLAALCAVVAYTLAFAPADIGPLGFVALWPWCVIVRRLRGWRLFAVASATGAAILGFGCAWIARTHPINLLFMVLPESLFFGGFALLLRALLVTRRWRAAAALPVAFTLVEALRGRFPLDGFPWLTLGYSQHGWLALLQVADLAGVHGVTFLLGLAAGALEDVRCAVDLKGRLLRLGPAIVLIGAGVGYGHLRLGDAETLPSGPRLLLIQPNIPQALKDGGATSSAEILARHARLTREGLVRSAPIDMVVWSETMLPLDFLPVAPEPEVARLEAAFVRREVVAAAGGEAVPNWLIGACTWIRPPDLMAGIFNSAILYRADGTRAALYHKRVLVPGGEYLPWIDALPASVADWIKRSVHEMAGFPPSLGSGDLEGVVQLAGHDPPVRAGVTICFEVAYPHVGRQLVRDGAGFLINLSNEAWFPDTAEFDQYAAMAVFRAAEVKRSLVKCANSGASGWIDPWGRPHLMAVGGDRSGFEAAIPVEPRLGTESTWYTRTGEWVAWGAALAALGGLILRGQRRATGP